MIEQIQLITFFVGALLVLWGTIEFVVDSQMKGVTDND